MDAPRQNPKERAVGIGDSVAVKFNSGAIKTFTVVHPHEINPAQGRISYNSPLGKALLGKKRGDRIVYEVDHQILRAEIGEIDP